MAECLDEIEVATDLVRQSATKEELLSNAKALVRATAINLLSLLQSKFPSTTDTWSHLNKTWVLSMEPRLTYLSVRKWKVKIITCKFRKNEHQRPSRPVNRRMRMTNSSKPCAGRWSLWRNRWMFWKNRMTSTRWRRLTRPRNVSIPSQKGIGTHCGIRQVNFLARPDSNRNHW